MFTKMTKKTQILSMRSFEAGVGHDKRMMFNPVSHKCTQLTEEDAEKKDEF